LSYLTHPTLGNFDKTVDALLNYKPPTTCIEPYKSPEEAQHQKNLETVHNMFGGDLTDLEKKLLDEEARHERALQEKLDKFSQVISFLISESQSIMSY